MLVEERDDEINRLIKDGERWLINERNETLVKFNKLSKEIDNIEKKTEKKKNEK